MHVDGSQFLNHFHHDCEKLLKFVPLESLLIHCQRCLFARSYVPTHEVICVSGSQYCSSLPSSWVCNITKFYKHLNFLQHICASGSLNMSGKDSAMLQLKMATSILCGFFKFQVFPGFPVKFRQMSTLLLAGGLKVTVTKRIT